MLDAYLYSGLRSPIARHAGKLANVRPDDLAAIVIREVIARSGFRPEDIEDVVLGCSCQAGEDSRNLGRHAALLAGLPPEVAGQTVNRLCGSGLAAVLDTARAVSCGEGGLYVAGGVESMTRAPFVVAKSESAFARDFKVFDTTIGARFPNPRIVEQYGNDTMPETADNIAAQFGLSREDSDRFAARSQAKYAAAKTAGFYTEEILPIAVPTGRKTPPAMVFDDEHPRPESDFDSLSRLKPLAAGGVAPRIMGVGPAYAIPKALERAGLSLADMDVIEINEAFAPQVLGCLKLLGLAYDDPRVNPNGGAIALGHPLGASGARIALTAARQLHRSGGRYAVVSLCIGVGHGIAVVIERA